MEIDNFMGVEERVTVDDIIEVMNEQADVNQKRIEKWRLNQ